MSSQFSEGKRPRLIFKRIAWILLPCVATAFIVRSYYLVRECETRKIEEVIRDGIVALSQKTRFESLEEWMDGRMTFKFSAKKEKGMWKLCALPELICK